tara:strand:+ start:167 stop:1255 length:1089 start_codon:yes stop_codon:yes gene_type:complete
MDYNKDFNLILNSLDDAIIIVDSENKILYQNSYSEKIFSNNFSGLPISNLVRDPIILESYQNVIRTKENHAVIFVASNFIDNLDIRENIFDVSIRYVDNADDFFIIITLKNITIQRNIERMRTDFIANVSHELKTPMSTIIGFLETINSTAIDDKEAQKKFIDIISREANRMSRLIEDLLVISRIESNEHIFPTSRVDIYKLINQVKQNLMKSAMEKSIKINVNTFEGELFILGNEDELLQVFTNLFENSIKYANQGSAITANYRLENSNVLDNNQTKLVKSTFTVIEIIDQSEGIPEKHISRLTERFYRIDAGRSREVGGTGLGLTIVKHILNKHRASLDIASKVGVGSVFTVKFPSALVK